MINGLRVAAITPLHFGASYLPYAMRSVAGVVDEFILCYSPTPNHGTYSSALPCPESRDMLLEAAYQTAPDRTRWFDWDGWKSEGEQFKFGWQYTDAGIILKLDCDEIYPPGLLTDAARYGIEHNAYEIRLPLRHYWRSFRKAFTHDPAAPGRIYLRNCVANGDNAVTFDTPDNAYRIHHYSYAQSLKLMEYKMSIHGHIREFRKDVDWLNDIFKANRQYDCHPCGSQYWMEVENVEVPYFMKDHPYSGLDLIE